MKDLSPLWVKYETYEFLFYNMFFLIFFLLNILPIYDAKERVKLTKKNWSTHAEKGEETIAWA